MANLNNVVLAGNLCSDLELRQSKAGNPVTNMRLAINRVYYAGEGENKEKREEVVFVDVVVWGKQAEICHKFLKKGSGVAVVGRLQGKDWIDEKTKEKRSKIEVVAENVQFLDKKSTGTSETSPKQETSTEPKKEGEDFF